MLVNENIDYYAGIFCFNPLDDPYHLERIERCLTSIIRAAKNTELRIKVAVGLNMSMIDGEAKIVGVGDETVQKIKDLCTDVEILEYKPIEGTFKSDTKWRDEECRNWNQFSRPLRGYTGW